MEFVDVVTDLLSLVNANDYVRGNKAALRIMPLREEISSEGRSICFSLENLTETNISIASIVTATFKSDAGNCDVAFVVSGSDTMIPAMTKKMFSALPCNSSIRLTPPYSLYQVHVTVLDP